MRGIAAYGPKNITECWQPVDAGHIGAMLKQLARSKFDSWMDERCTEHPELSNWQAWDQRKLSARSKRIMMTWVFGDAYEELRGPKYYEMRRRAFETTGLHIKLTTISDGLAQVEGIDGPLGLVAPDQPFLDHAYAAESLSRHPNFFPVSVDAQEDSSDSSSSSSGSSSSSKSDSATLVLLTGEGRRRGGGAAASTDVAASAWP